MLDVHRHCRITCNDSVRDNAARALQTGAPASDAIARSDAGPDAPEASCIRTSLEPAQQLRSAERVRRHHPSLAVPRLLVQRRAKHRPVRHLNSSSHSNPNTARTYIVHPVPSSLVAHSLCLVRPAWELHPCPTPSYLLNRKSSPETIFDTDLRWTGSQRGPSRLRPKFVNIAIAIASSSDPARRTTKTLLRRSSKP